MSLSIIIQAEPFTRRFVVELQQDADFTKQKFSIKPDRPSLQSNASNIACYTKPDLPPDHKRHKPDSYRLKTTLIESISWQLFYATHLLVSYELILINKSTLAGSSPYSWIPAEAVISVGWFLKSFGNSYSPLFNPIEQQETGSMSTPFAIVTGMYGYGNYQQQYRPSASSVQQAPGTTTQPTGFFTSPLNTNHGEGNGAPEERLHTLGLNCYTYPCMDVCLFRPSSLGREPTEWPLNLQESLTSHTAATPGQGSCPHLVNSQCHQCIGYFDSEGAIHAEKNLLLEALKHPTDIQLPLDYAQVFESQAHQPEPHDSNGKPANSCNYTNLAVYTTTPVRPHNDDLPMTWNMPSTTNDFTGNNEAMSLLGFTDQTGISFTFSHSETQKTTTESPQSSQSPAHLLQPVTTQAPVVPENITPGTTHCQQALPNRKRKKSSKSQTCDVTVIGEDGQQRLCGVVCRNAHYLSSHKNSSHCGQQTCDVTVFTEDGQRLRCGSVCKNARILACHKKRIHSGQKTCKTTVSVEDGQRQPCGKICKSAQALSDHKRTAHSGQKTCKALVVTGDDQQRPCGKVCQSAKALTLHKGRYHTGQKTCNKNMIGEDGLSRICGRVCENAMKLSAHRKRDHSGQYACDKIVIVENGLSRPCGKICINTIALSDHKRRNHSRKQTRDETVVGDDGLPRHCGLSCKNTQALSDHKSRHHTGQQSFDITVNGKDGQSRSCGTVYKNAKPLRKRKSGHLKSKSVNPNQN
ncbi:hypothetical protein [Endozoicomonas sp. 8E]|uniref:hypothetical protein n=1 Tax=Endozoicomonas sp. 8E TaxID=3035692 RepID=UPI00293913E1|nr:hypothetical protein [Endozoicomonas sp. 8E]WOG27055.1 hypothetical protein P6910_21270 [Endozoicomonas sp. 8E]